MNRAGLGRSAAEVVRMVEADLVVDVVHLAAG